MKTPSEVSDESIRLQQKSIINMIQHYNLFPCREYNSKSLNNNVIFEPFL